MLTFALALAAVVSPVSQTLAGTAFDAFAQDADLKCPSRHLREITPGDLSWEQESFVEQISAAQRRKLDGANLEDRLCANSNGLACSTTQTLAAIERTGLLPSLVQYSCTHPAPIGVIRKPISTATDAPTSSAIMRRLDLNSFPNSTGPRRKISLHTPTDYGFTNFKVFPDGWAQLSEPNDEWHMSALLLDWKDGVATICFVDAGGGGARYRATQVIRTSLDSGARWKAMQVGDRPDCRNDPRFPVKAGVSVGASGGLMAREFGSLCLDRPSSTAAIRKRASDRGWHQTDRRGELGEINAEGSLTLNVSDSESAGEARQVCTVGTDQALSGTVQATKALLGFEPAVDLGTSATFFAVRDAVGWHSGAALGTSSFQAAKREGRFYSVIASNGDSSSQIVAIHITHGN
ncbi:hypothetical protein [Sphingomonas sp. Leaf357]|uniref:hypothetical protein n=1 Tax=Sphingomonas sp. Leaf357 TaxID=1736350 RepID=UPI000AEBFA61|nr:hypothetical protein [Sphingomonas sp. Leaf357]